MKKLVSLIICAITINVPALAQKGKMRNVDTAEATPLQNSFYAEIGGAALLGVSANYERFLGKGPGGFSVRAGLGVGYVPGIFFEGQLYAALPLREPFRQVPGQGHADAHHLFAR